MPSGPITDNKEAYLSSPKKELNTFVCREVSLIKSATGDLGRFGGRAEVWTHLKLASGNE